MNRAVKWYPPSYDIRVEDSPIPEIEHPDDAIVKVALSGLCGSDLHIYRGHGGINVPVICGHEFIGEITALGGNYGTTANNENRPHLYSALKVGHRVVSPFTVNCGECHVCRVGFTCRCPSGNLFGTPALAGGQAQYVRVPFAGGTLFSLSDTKSWGSTSLTELQNIQDSSLLLLADILPTGVFAALQALGHPKILPMITGTPYPYCLIPSGGVGVGSDTFVQVDDKMLTFAIIGLGPVGVCTAVSLLDMLAARQLPFKIIAIDPIKARREKMNAVYAKIDISGRGYGKFVTKSIEEAGDTVREWTNGVGCTSVLEVVGNNSALTLAYDLVRAFGTIVSVGVHQEPPVPFTGRALYNKNVSFDFGRCPARAMFPLAFDLLVKRQDVFGTVGDQASLVDRIVGFKDAAESYELFDKGKCGKVIFDPWK